MPPLISSKLDWGPAQREGGVVRIGLSRPPPNRRKANFNLEDWDWDATERVFVSLIHAKDWKAVTGEAAQNEPPTAKDYTEAGLPWFDYYAKDLVALSGSAALAGVKSIAEVFADKTGAQLAGSSDITIGKPVTLAPDIPGPRPVRSSSSW